MADHALYNMKRREDVPPRWTATIWYRTDAGLIDVEHVFEEIDMLHMLVERGPDFYTIEKIEVKHTRNTMPNLTIEGNFSSAS